MAQFDPYRKWLGIPSDEQPANHYRLLGVELFESDPEVIQTAADRQMAYVAKCAQGPYVKLSQKILNELSAARVCLLNEAKRQAYDAKLRQSKGAAIVETVASDAEESATVHEFQFTMSETADGPINTRLTRRQKSSLPFVGIGLAAALMIGVAIWQFSKPAEKLVGKGRANSASQSHAASEPQDTAATTTGSSKPLKEANPTEASQTSTANTASSVDNMPALTASATPQNTSNTADLTPPDSAANSNSAVPAPAAPDMPLTKTEDDKKADSNPAKPKASTPTKPNSKKAEPADNELANLPFDPPRLADSVPDKDKSAESLARLSELSQRASESNKACVAIVTEARPLFAERVTIANSLPAKQVAMTQAGVAVKQLDSRLAVLKQRPRFSNTADPVNAEEDKLNEQRGRFNEVFERNKNEIAAGVARIEELDRALKDLSERMQQKWEELRGCRKQWLELCRPQDKYARADLEGSRQVIENWLKVDELWVDGFCWGALCAYDLGDHEKANELVDRAEKLRIEVLRSAKPIPLIEATQGLLILSSQGKRSKSPSIIQKAITHVDRDRDWQTHFVAGRATSEIGRLDGKAKAYFERALGIESDCQHAAFWLGRLLTSSTDKTVRNVEEGIRLLEDVWKMTGERSWRISFALVQAYDAGARADQATKQWETTLALAPVREHERLKKERSE